MGGTLLFFVYSAVMLAALGCFVQAFRVRRHTPRHKRWAGLGVLLTVGGIVVVLAVTYLMDLRVPQRYPSVVRIHRILALVTTVVVLLTAWTGWRRVSWHGRLYGLFFLCYTATLVTALIGYRP